MWNSFEQRKFPRIHKECGISVATDKQNKILHSVTENIGLGGFCALLPEPLEKFSKVQVKVALKNGDAPLECGARIVWSIKQRDFDPKKVNYDTGFEFTDLSPEDRVRLKNYLLTLA